jgi:Zn-finger nucleic acid-binding protein
MSSVELGHDGIWSCLYCEGTWLTREQVETAIAQRGSFDGAQTWSVHARRLTGANHDLTCPSCRTQSFQDIACAGESANYCASCRSIFFRKGVLHAIAPGIDADGAGAAVVGRKTAITATEVMVDLALGVLIASLFS